MLNESTGVKGKGAFYLGAFLALIYVCFTGIWGAAGTVIATSFPYMAGVGMFAALLAIFGAIVLTLKKVRKNSRKQIAIMDCYIAVAVIGVAGYFLAACVQVFQPGANPADLWVHGAVSAAIFTAIFGGGRYMAQTYIAGGKK